MNTVENLQRAAQMIWDAAAVLEAAHAEVDSALISAVDLLTLPEVIPETEPETGTGNGCDLPPARHGWVWIPVVSVDEERGTMFVQ